MKAQTHVNKEWATTNGNPLGLDWSNSITTANSELISVGNTLIAGQGANMLTTQYHQDGSIAWQHAFNTSGANNDLGIAVTQDASGNVLVVGPTNNGGFVNHDLVVLKYNALGMLLWHRTYNSPHNKNDIGTAIKTDADNNVYVCGSSDGSTTNFDYLALKYSPTGALQWAARYDYAALVEIPLGIDLDVNGNVFVTGASASSAVNWDYTIAKFDPNTGGYLGETRNAVLGAGFDQPMSYKKDDAGNIYITGRSSVDGVNYDIKTIKLNASFVMQWTKTLDLSGKEDVGNSVDVDNNGNVYIGGYATKGDNQKEGIAVKYDANGNEIWRHEQASSNTTGEALIKALDVTSNGEIYFIGQEKGANGSKDVVISKLSGNGSIEWQKELDTPIDEKPSAINVADDGSIYVSALKDGATDTYETVCYKDLKVDNNIVFDATGKPLYKANELIVRFQASAMNRDAVDNNLGTKEADFGDLDYWLTPDAMAEVNNALSSLCVPANTSRRSLENPCGVKGIKIFRQLRTTDTISISRSGGRVRIPDFWTTLLLQFPVGSNLEQIYIALNGIPNIVRTSESNRIGLMTNDPEYSNQFSLNYNGTNLNLQKAHINIEPAWEIVPNGGSNTVRCGVFDSGIDYQHEDFQYTNNLGVRGTKIAGGWAFGENVSTFDLPNPDNTGHGTSCAGIIGAVRNNNLGIVGIAGGNVIANLNQTGIALYDMRILPNNSFLPSSNPTLVPSLNYVSEAIVISSLDSLSRPRCNGCGYNFALHLTSHSWSYDEDTRPFDSTNNTLMRDALHFANRNEVTICAARGNSGTDNKAIPATMDDDWVLCVGGTGNNGKFMHDIDGLAVYPDGQPNGPSTVSFGHNVDVGAPAHPMLIKTLARGGGYQSFSHTSAATPHVSGVVGLLMSYLNQPTPHYQNLAPEDCEHIIEMTAKDDDFIVGYDQFIGAGLLNAGAALQRVKKPENRLVHFGYRSNSGYLFDTLRVATGVIVRIPENYTKDSSVRFSPGRYKVDIIRIDVRVKHRLNLVTNERIDTFWARSSSSNVWANLIGDTLQPRERVKMNYCNDSICSMTGYVYKVYDMSNNPIDWIPFEINPSMDVIPRFEYTILTSKRTPNATKDINGFSNISVYPNPTNSISTLMIDVKLADAIEINLLDIHGRVVKNVIKANCLVGKNEYNVDVSDIAAGMYMYVVKYGGVKNYVKFVKQ